MDSPWLKLRQAQEAVDHHRPEDAHRLIEPLMAAGYRRAWRLARTVVREYAARATKAIEHHNPDAAWRDLLAAEALNTGEKVLADLRQTLARLGLVQARASLEAGKPAEALAAVGRLHDRGVRHPDLAGLEDASRVWAAAAELADRGEFPRALAELDQLRAFLPDGMAAYGRVRAAIEDRYRRFRQAVGQLYDAAGERRWRETVVAADEVLALAPEHREARAIRAKAWQAAAPSIEDYRNLEEAEVVDDAEAATAPKPLPAAASTARGAGASGSMPRRFLLWVDGVGAYLVCLGKNVAFGQAAGEGPVDVPLFADVSRLHAEISRDTEGYVVESARSVQVNGTESPRAVLAPGDRITLGSTCQFSFHRPVSVSATACLALTSGHRLPVAVDGVLLMANEVLLGPGPEAHVILPHVPEPVLIYRSKEGLGVRVPNSAFRVDDRPCHDRAPLPLPAVVTAETFSFAVEPVTSRL